MTEKLIQFEGGDVFANLEERTITGLLIPYNEVGRTNLGRFQVEAGAIEIPADPAVVGLNLDHVRHSGVGRAMKLEEKLDAEVPGIYATLYVAKTPEGDAALADAVDPNGKRRKLSAEFGPAMIKAGKLVAGHAKLWGAALVGAGAFPSAQVLAEDTPDAGEPKESTEKFTDEFTDENGKKFKRTTARTTRTEPDGDGGTKTTITEKTVLEEPDAAAPADEEEDPAVGVPNTLASKAGAPAGTTQPRVDLQNVYAAFAAFRANPNADEARQVLAALSDIKISGAGALPAAGVIRENWVGQLYQGIPYERQYITLGNQGTDITAGGKKGFKVHRGAAGAPVDSFAGTADWAGNKAAIASGSGFTETAASTLHRFAFGNDIAREFYDLPGGLEIVEAFLKLIVEDHLVWSDEKARLAWIAAAGAAIAPNTAAFPAEFSGTLGMLIQGILRVKRKKADNRRDKPSFAILNEAAFEELAYTPFEHLPEYIKFSVNTDGTGLADGDVLVTQGDIGIENTPAVLVGAKYAIDFDELAGGPLHIDALELAKGGIDKALHGYLQVFQQRAEAVVLVGTADAP